MLLSIPTSENVVIPTNDRKCVYLPVLIKCGRLQILLGPHQEFLDAGSSLHLCCLILNERNHALHILYIILYPDQGAALTALIRVLP